MHDIYRVCFDEGFVGVVLLAMTEKYKTIIKGAVTLCNLFCNLSRNEFILRIRVS